MTVCPLRRSVYNHPRKPVEGKGEILIAIGLYAQAKEFLAVHRNAVERPYRSDTDALAPIRLDRWTAWAWRAHEDAEATATKSPVLLSPVKHRVSLGHLGPSWRSRD